MSKRIIILFLLFLFLFLAKNFINKPNVVFAQNCRLVTVCKPYACTCDDDGNPQCATYFSQEFELNGCVNCALEYNNVCACPNGRITCDISEVCTERCENPTPTPTRTPTPTPTRTPTPTPTRTPTPTPTLTNSNTPILNPPSSCSLKSKGDANCDNKIDGIDYSYWLNRQCANNCDNESLKADFNFDQKVDVDDYNIWFNNRI